MPINVSCNIVFYVFDNWIPWQENDSIQLSIDFSLCITFFETMEKK